MKKKIFSSPSRVNSFQYAIRGIRNFFSEEPNARIHLLVTVAVLIVAGYLQVSRVELICLVIAIGFVWVAEVFNTVIERIMDFISPAYHEAVGVIKDMSAAAVLVSAIVAAATGLIILIPKII